MEKIEIPYDQIRCPICGGHDHKRTYTKIERRRRERQWKKDWRNNSYGRHYV